MKAAVKREAQRLRDVFIGAGAVEVEADILQPAGTLLDLYGEDIRARAYTTSDPLRGEMMLRPDFTVPVVQMHMAHGADPARYTYAGEVFRRQEDDPSRASEYLQVGYEVFARENPHEADAEVFALFSEVLGPLDLRPVTGDIGILTAAVRGLATSEARKAALMRHIWRPKRFRQLLDRFSGRAEVPEGRTAMLALEDAMAKAGPIIGMRSASEISKRIEALREDAATAPIEGDQLHLINSVLSIRDMSDIALASLQNIALQMPVLSPAVSRLADRLSALEAGEIDPATLPFQASFGRTLLEYYDGFVFGFHASPDMAPVATGGRYDALTRQLGEGSAIPAVGGAIRPGLVVELLEARA